MTDSIERKLTAFMSFLISDIIRLQGNTSEDAHTAFMKKAIADANELDALLKGQYKKDPAASITFENGGWLKSGMYIMWKHHHAFIALKHPGHEIRIANSLSENRHPSKAVYVNSAGVILEVQDQ